MLDAAKWWLGGNASLEGRLCPSLCCTAANERVCEIDSYDKVFGCMQE